LVGFFTSGCFAHRGLAPAYTALGRALALRWGLGGWGNLVGFFTSGCFAHRGLAPALNGIRTRSPFEVGFGGMENIWWFSQAPDFAHRGLAAANTALGRASTLRKHYSKRHRTTEPHLKRYGSNCLLVIQKRPRDLSSWSSPVVSNASILPSTPS